MARRAWIQFAVFHLIVGGLVPCAMAQDDPFDDEDPEGVDLAPVVPGGEVPVDDPVGGDGVDGPSGPLADVVVGVSMRQRSFTLDSVDANLDFSSSLYPTVHVGASAFPLAGKGWLGNIGLTGSFARGVDTTIIDEGGVIRKVPTRHSETGIMVAYRHRLGETLWLQAETGVLLLDFVLADNPFYSSTTYRAWQLSVKGVYSALPWLNVEGGLDLLPLVGLGVSEEEFGQDSSTFGASAHIALEADIVAGLYVHGGYDLLALSSTFTGRGARGLESAVTTDIFHSLSIWGGYRF